MCLSCLERCYYQIKQRMQVCMSFVKIKDGIQWVKSTQYNPIEIHWNLFTLFTLYYFDSYSNVKTYEYCYEFCLAPIDNCTHLYTNSV